MKEGGNTHPPGKGGCLFFMPCIPSIWGAHSSLCAHTLLLFFSVSDGAALRRACRCCSCRHIPGRPAAAPSCQAPGQVRPGGGSGHVGFVRAGGGGGRGRGEDVYHTRLRGESVVCVLHCPEVRPLMYDNRSGTTSGIDI